jgi:SapC
MKISAPIGYEQITPLTKGQRVALPRADATPASFQRLHAIPLSLAEFEPACRDYPIVFVTGDDGLTFSTMAVLGLQENQNLFVMTDGAWDRRVYLPAYVRRYPFCMAKVSMNGEPVPERMICVESSALNEKGELLHGPDGRAQPRWASMEKLIIDYENDLARSEELAKLLAEFNVLEPFSMRAEIDGFTMQLEGMHRVTQASLETLGDDQIRRLMAGGLMAKLYAHLISLDNFRRLLSRRSFFAIKAPASQQELN